MGLFVFINIVLATITSSLQDSTKQAIFEVPSARSYGSS